MFSIQLLGLADHEKTNQLRSNIEQALKELKIDNAIELIFDIDAMMQYSINGIPALVVDGNVIFQRVVPSTSEIIHYLKDLINISSNPLSIKKILVPVDFSRNAKNALSFAIEFSRSFDASIEVMHSWTRSDQASYITISDGGQLGNVKERLSRLVESASKQYAEQANTVPPITTTIVEGLPIDTITKKSLEKDVDLLVMSHTELERFTQNLFGSVAASVTQKSNKPILFVPKGAKFQNFRSILFASNMDSVNSTLVQNISTFAQLFQAAIHFVYVEEQLSQAETIKKALTEKLAHTNSPTLPLNFHTIQAQSVIKGLQSFVTDHKIDLLVLTTQHRSFWQQLFHDSVTQKMLVQTQIPLLIMYDTPNSIS